MNGRTQFCHILGIDFFCGSSQEAIALMRRGGLLVAPSAPALKDVAVNREYRESLVNADLVITDSAYMVLIWHVIDGHHLQRLSGLRYMRQLLLETDIRASGNTLWIMASAKSAETNVAWLAKQGIEIPEENVYTAPMYGSEVQDTELLERLNRLRPQHVVVTIAGGVQERLGLYLKRNLEYLPAIHCTGAAIAFLSGDQVNITVLADRIYLGWLYRCIAEPKRCVPRYWEARRLLGLMLKYRGEMPPLKLKAQPSRSTGVYSAGADA